MTGLVSVYATFADEAEARRIGRAMVERRLAACVNVLAPSVSIYRFEGEVAEAVESPALFKTSTNLAEPLTAAIAEAHSYRVPAIVAWPVAHSPAACAAWVAWVAWVADDTGPGHPTR